MRKKRRGRLNVGNQGWSTKAKPTTPKPFRVMRSCNGWAVKQGINWRHALEVSVLAPVLATGDGELVGVGVVTRKGTTIVITG